MPKVILTTDLSAQAKNAIATGIQWANQFGMQPIIAHVEEHPEENNPAVTRTTANKLKDAKFDMLDDAVVANIKEHLSEWPDLDFEYWKGDQTDSILQSIQENQAEMIICGLKAHTLVEEVILGSLAKDMIEKSPVSVLCIHSDLKTLPKKPLYCCDFLTTNNHAYELSKKYSNLSGVSFDILHLISPKTISEMKKENDIQTDEAIRRAEGFAMDDLQKVADQFHCEVSTHVANVEKHRPGEVILNKAKELNSDLIIMGKRELQGLQKFFEGSSTLYVAKRAERSILITK